jgi:hypothetical protein
MNAVILPKEQIVIFEKGSADNKPTPVVTSVLSVRRGAIYVPEARSHNGIATIVSHGTSADGHYWYEYCDKELKPCSLDIVALHKLEGDKIITEQFIND